MANKSRIVKTVVKKNTNKKELKPKVDKVTDNLTEKQRHFCLEYMRNGNNGMQAAIKAGYSNKTAKEQASYLLTNVNISKFLDQLKNDLGLRIGISAEAIASEMAKIGFSNVKSIFDDEGNLKPVGELSDAEAACIASIEVEELFAGRGANREPIGTIKKIKLWNKQTALNDLNSMLGYTKPVKVAQTDSDGNDVAQQPLTLTTLTQLITGK